MSDKDYHEGYFEGIRNAYVAFSTRRSLGTFEKWISKELSSSKIIKEDYASDPYE